MIYNVYTDFAMVEILAKVFVQHHAQQTILAQVLIHHVLTYMQHSVVQVALVTTDIGVVQV